MMHGFLLGVIIVKKAKIINQETSKIKQAAKSYLDINMYNSF